MSQWNHTGVDRLIQGLMLGLVLLIILAAGIFLDYHLQSIPTKTQLIDDQILIELCEQGNNHLADRAYQLREPGYSGTLLWNLQYQSGILILNGERWLGESAAFVAKAQAYQMKAQEMKNHRIPDKNSSENMIPDAKSGATVTLKAYQQARLRLKAINKSISSASKQPSNQPNSQPSSQSCHQP